MDYKHWCRPVAVGIRSTDPSTAMAEATTGVRRSELVCNLRAGDLGGCARAVAYGKKFAYVNPRMVVKTTFRRRATLNIGRHHPLQITSEGVLS